MPRQVKHLHVPGCHRCPFLLPPATTGGKCLCDLVHRQSDDTGPVIEVEDRYIRTHAEPPAWCPRRTADFLVSFSEAKPQDVEVEELLDVLGFADRMRARRENRG